jgi:hypothetical protein
MSVRATGSLIAEVVIASGLSNSPKMIVKAVNEEAKLVTTVWFSNSNEIQEGTFPTGALDRAEEKKAPAKAGKSTGNKPSRKPNKN